MEIKLNNLSKIYQNNSKFTKQLFTNLNLTILPGEIIGIVGPIASGKSTLISLISGLILPTTGTVQLDDFTIEAKTKLRQINKLRSKINITFQNPNHQLFKTTVREELGFILKNNHLSKLQITNEVNKIANDLEISPQLLKKSPFNLSSGEKRKIVLASLLISKPEVIILDEPTVYLDHQNKQLFAELLLKIHQTSPVTIIIASHDVEFISKLAMRIITLNDGQIVSDLSIKKFLKQDNF